MILAKCQQLQTGFHPPQLKGCGEFLGFTGYYRRFVPDYSTVAQPLVRLLGKDCKFKWTETCQDAFMALRALLIKAPILAFPKEDLPYIVDTDPSGLWNRWCSFPVY